MTLPSSGLSAITSASPAAASLSPEAKAAVAIAEMRQKMLQQLWQAVLSDTGDNSSEGSADSGGAGGNAFGGLLTPGLQALIAAQTDSASRDSFVFSDTANGPTGPLNLGTNASYSDEINAAASRTGLPPSMLAAIIGAEADTKGGQWDPYSRNPRSSAAGLTQFLDSTWLSQAERPGTYLNTLAANNGWLGANGRVLAGAQSTLLDLRYNPRASIEAAADYARTNLQALQQRGLVPQDAGPETLAKVAYLAHHLGSADAARFLGGNIDPNRARALLRSQIGASAADQRIDSTGNATLAHRQWLTSYVDKKIDLDRYQKMGLGAGSTV